MHYEYGKKHKVGYRLFRNGKAIKTFENNKKYSFKDSDLKSNKKYKYKVKAFYIVIKEKKGKKGRIEKKEKKIWSPPGKIKISTKGEKVEKKKKPKSKNKKKATKKTSKKSNSKTKKKTTKKATKKTNKKSKK